MTDESKSLFPFLYLKRPWPVKPDPWLTSDEVAAMVDRVLAPIRKALRG